MKPNEKIGPYRLLEPLGSGGMGAVWRAWDERLKRSIALKQILPAATEDLKRRERFRREAEAAARLNHPAIVHIYDIVETEAGDWIVMELVEGQTIQKLLQDGPLEPRLALRLGREIVDGLAEAHAQGFIHRDLKASNVMVTQAGRAKILDFGVAKQIHLEAQDTTLSRPGVVVGTSYAMSPEQAMGLPLDARSDLFSLGSFLYELVTGVAPFRAETAAATLARVCSFRQRPALTLCPEIPRAFSHLIDRLLEKNPIDRPQSAVEVAAAMDQIAAAQTPFAVRAPVPRGDVEASDENTILEAPPPVLSRATGASGHESATYRARSIRPVLGIFLLLIAAIVAGRLLNAPAVPATPQALYQQGMAYLDRADRKGNLDLAIDSFQRVLAQDANHAAAHAGLAKAYWFKLQTASRDPMWLEQALSMAERAVALDPYLADAHVSLGLALGSAGRPEEAMQHIERALMLEPRNGDAYYAAGRIYSSQGKLRDAEAAYKKAAEIEPNRLHFDELGSLYFRMSRTAEAVAAFRRSIEVAPDCPIGYRNLGAAFYMQGDLAEASSQFQRALQIRPDAPTYANVGTIQFAQGFYQLSAEAFEKALEMPGGSNNYMIWGNLGDAYRWTPDKKEKAGDAYLRAIQIVQEQLRLTPGDPTLRSRLALYLAKRGDRAQALEELNELEKRPDKDASSWLRMIVAYEVAAHREQALATLGRALRAGLPIDEVKKDPELLGLRADARYHRLIAGISES
jgi:serine/threonine-protein kinase